MKWLLLLAFTSLIAACEPGVSEPSTPSASNPHIHRNFRQPQATELRSGKPVDASLLEKYLDEDIYYTAGFGQKQDKTGILWVRPVSEKPDKLVYISKVTLITPNFTLEKDINEEFLLTKEPRQHYSHPVKIMEDIDFNDIPMDTKFITVEVEYKASGVLKTMPIKMIAEIRDLSFYTR